MLKAWLWRTVGAVAAVGLMGGYIWTQHDRAVGELVRHEEARQVIVTKNLTTLTAHAERIAAQREQFTRIEAALTRIQEDQKAIRSRLADALAKDKHHDTGGP